VFLRYIGKGNAPPEDGFIVTERGHTINYALKPKSTTSETVLVTLVVPKVAEAVDIAPTGLGAVSASDGHIPEITAFLRSVIISHVDGKSPPKRRSGTILIFFIASNVLGRSPQSILANAGGGRIDTRIVADRTSGASPEDVWISNAEVQIKELGELIGTLRNEVKASEERANQAVSDLAAVIDKRVNTLEGETADAVIDLTSRIDETGERGVADTSREIAEGVELTSLDLGAAPPREFVTGGQGFQPAVLAGQARPVASNTDPVERGPNGQIIELEPVMPRHWFLRVRMPRREPRTLPARSRSFSS